MIKKLDRTKESERERVRYLNRVGRRKGWEKE